MRRALQVAAALRWSVETAAAPEYLRQPTTN